MNTNIFDCHYVKISPNLHETLRKLEETPVVKSQKLADIIAKLHLIRPTWEYVFVGRAYNGQLDKFEVRQNGEELGTVDLGWSRRAGNDTIEVTNKRIDRSMQRGSSYKTADVDKAVAKIKKMFGAKSIAERLEEATSKAASTVMTNQRHMYQSLGNPNRTINEAMLAYAKGPGKPDFLHHLETDLPPSEKDKIVTALETQERLSGELAAITEVHDALGTAKSAMIVKTDTGYIFKRGEQTDILTDATLPDAVRGSLGLLKLVEVEHYIVGVGCRLDEDLFIVLMKEEA